MSEKELSIWLERFHTAEASLNNRDGLAAQATAELETNLELIGVTGLEDRLQIEVPETIALLQTAGIRLWVLTSDKVETAIAIGRTSKIILPSSTVLIVSEINSVRNQFEQFITNNREYIDPVLIVAGDALELAMYDDFELFRKVSDIVVGCDSRTRFSFRESARRRRASQRGLHGSGGWRRRK